MKSVRLETLAILNPIGPLSSETRHLRFSKSNIDLKSTLFFAVFYFGVPYSPLIQWLILDIEH
jgi:hypothetical protein